MVRRGLGGQLVEQSDVDGEVQHPVHVAEPEAVPAPLQELHGLHPRAVPRLGVRPVGQRVQHHAAAPAGDLLHVDEHGRPVPSSPVLGVGVDLQRGVVEVVDEGQLALASDDGRAVLDAGERLAEPVALVSLEGYQRLLQRPRGPHVAPVEHLRGDDDGVPRRHGRLVERVDPHDLHQSLFCTSRQRSTTR